MRKATALVVGTLLAVLGLPGTGQAQSSVQVQGTLQAVDCGAQIVVLSSPGNSNTIAAASYTAVLVNSTSVPFCSLTQYVGAPASAWLVATGSEFVATRIDVVGQVAVAPVVPVAPVTVVEEPLPIEGIVLGTIFVAGLLFLLTRDDDDHFYRYPYYGRYYHHYYRPEYQPYRGPYPSRVPPVITVPQRVAGSVLGTTEVSGLQYLVVRERNGELARYPYYGPYHKYYYRPEYRPYRGQNRDAPVRQGDVRWDPPAYRTGQGNQGESPGIGGPWPAQQGGPRMTPPALPPGYRDGRNDQGSPESRGIVGPLPMRQSDPRMTPPVLPPGYRDGRNNQGGPESRGIVGPPQVRQSDPRWSVPRHQNDPSVRRPDWNRPVFQNGNGWGGPRQNTPRYPQPAGRCGGNPNRPCSDGGISPTR